MTHLGGLWAFLATEMSFEFLGPVYVGNTVAAEAQVVEVNDRGWPSGWLASMGKRCCGRRFAATRGGLCDILHPTMSETDLLARITFNPQIFGGKPIVRGRRLAVEHVLGMLAAGDTPQTLLTAYPWLETDDVRACLLYARRVVVQERIEPLNLTPA